MIAQQSNTFKLGLKCLLYWITTFSEGKLYLSTSLNPTIALHIEIISLVDGTYELIQGPDEDTFEVQINTMEDNKDLNMNPKSKSELHEAQPTFRN